MNSYNQLILILVFIAHLYLFKSLVRHILVLITDLYLFRSPVGITKLILVFLADLYLYRGTRRYYIAYTYTEVPVGTTELIFIQRYM